MRRVLLPLLVLALSVLACAQCSSGRTSASGVPARPMRAVDLGLSVCWGTCNVGAAKPEDFGEYYAWGETSPKSDYSWANYTLCNGSYTTLTKYCTSAKNGTVDNRTILEPDDDVAHVVLGGKWRMPTDEEWTELRDTTNCDWTWTTLNGVKGYQVTSKKPGHIGKSIFLPAAGYRNDKDLIDAGHYGIYWSSFLNTRYPRNAYRVDFVPDSVGRYYYRRCYGRSVRPVRER